VEEERARSMNLDGGRAVEAHMEDNEGCAGGVDLDDGCVVEVHAEEERGMRCEPQCRARRWRGPRRQAHGGGACGGGVRHRCGGGRCGVEANAEEEHVPTCVWQENDRVRVYRLGHT
jgi:hypothetical protein